MCSEYLSPSEGWRFLTHSFLFICMPKNIQIAVKKTKKGNKKKAQKFSIGDGILFYTAANHDQQWIAEKTKQQQFVKTCHGNIFGGHFGRDKTREKITSR